MNAAPTPLTVVLLNDAAHLRGGVERVLFASARGLRSLGHRVIVFAGRGPVSPELSEIPGLEVICLEQANALDGGNALAGAARILWNRQASARLKQTLRDLDPARTIVHAHCYTQTLSPSVLAVATRAGFKTVLTLHDYFLVCPNGAFFEYPTEKICHRQPLSWDCVSCRCDARRHSHKLLRVARAWVKKYIAGMPSRLTALIAISELSRARVRPHVPSSLPIHLVPNPVNATAGEPAQVEANRAFLFSGRLERFKGGHIFAAAAARSGVDAVFAGAGPAEADWKGLYPKSRFTGWLNSAQLDAELTRARAVVFPSLWPEGYGLAAVEALARGVPVIASKGTAAEEYISDGENGFLFEQGSVDDLQRKIDLLRVPGVAAKLGAEAHRRFWSAPPTTQTHVAGLLAVYRDALGKGAA